MARSVDTLVATNSMIRINPEVDSLGVAGGDMLDKGRAGLPPLGSSTSMNTVDTRPCDGAREKAVANQQMPLRRWPLAALEKHLTLADLQYV